MTVEVHDTMIRNTIYFGILSATMAIGLGTRAELVLPSVMGEHMVLQRETEAAIWGWDEPGREVTVRFRGRTVAAEADATGKWLARVQIGRASCRERV
jgi:sialate O-acetylesterase